ncbi:hypothetical protein ACLOJK_024689 [Asimina triloba]
MLLLDVSAHGESCRAVRFIDSGRAILTTSADCSILATDVETGTSIARLEDAHGAAINRLICLTERTVSTGDDDGCVWDTRQHSCCNTFNAHEEYISDMTFVSHSMQLLGTSGDGTLSVCSLRKNKASYSVAFPSPTSVRVFRRRVAVYCVMKNGKKVICGTQMGALLLYSWGYFKDCSDRFLGHPMSVDKLIKLDEDTLISGSEDGVIRLVGILPNRIIQPIAEHSEYPIEGLAFSHDRKHLGSISHDQMLKLWDLHELLEGPQSAPKSEMIAADSDDDEMDVDTKASKSSKGSKRKRENKGQGSSMLNSGFFADLEERSGLRQSWSVIIYCPVIASHDLVVFMASHMVSQGDLQASEIWQPMHPLFWAAMICITRLPAFFKINPSHSFVVGPRKHRWHIPRVSDPTLSTYQAWMAPHWMDGWMELVPKMFCFPN